MKLLPLARPLRCVSALLGFLMPFAALSAASPPSPTPDEIEPLAEEAYLFSAPLLASHRQMYTRTVDESSPAFRAPWNQLHRAPSLAGAGARAANNDTLYSSASLDLRGEPMIVTIPALPPDRYWSVQVVDPHLYEVGLASPRTQTTSGGNFLIAGPGWRDEKPSGVTEVFTVNANLAHVLVRLAVYGPDDLSTVVALQAGVRLIALSEFLGRPAPPPPPRIIFPPPASSTAQPEDFIRIANFLLGECAAQPGDAAALSRFRVLGLGARVPFDPAELTTPVRDALRRGVERALARIRDSQEIVREPRGSWGLSVGYGGRRQLQNQSLLRAVSAGAPMGLPPEEASYFGSIRDSDGELLDAGSRRYILRFSPATLPRMQGFWSLTVYDANRTILANPLNRFSIGDRTAGLQYGADGSLTILLQHASPGPDQESNWFPTPAGPFRISLRVYLPDPAVAATYIPPPVVSR